MISQKIPVSFAIYNNVRFRASQSWRSLIVPKYPEVSSFPDIICFANGCDKIHVLWEKDRDNAWITFTNIEFDQLDYGVISDYLKSHGMIVHRNDVVVLAVMDV